MGKAMQAACHSAKVNDRFQESVYLVLELLRAGVVHGHRFGQGILSGGPSYGDENEQKSALLIMRVLSVLPLQFRVSGIWYHVSYQADLSATTMGRPLITRTTHFQLFRSCRIQVDAPIDGSDRRPYGAVWRCSAKQR